MTWNEAFVVVLIIALVYLIVPYAGPKQTSRQQHPPESFRNLTRLHELSEGVQQEYRKLKKTLGDNRRSGLRFSNSLKHENHPVGTWCYAHFGEDPKVCAFVDRNNNPMSVGDFLVLVNTQWNVLLEDAPAIPIAQLNPPAIPISQLDVVQLASDDFRLDWEEATIHHSKGHYIFIDTHQSKHTHDWPYPSAKPKNPALPKDWRFSRKIIEYLATIPPLSENPTQNQDVPVQPKKTSALCNFDVSSLPGSLRSPLHDAGFVRIRIDCVWVKKHKNSDRRKYDIGWAVHFHGLRAQDI